MKFSKELENCLYRKETEYGFVTEQNRDEQELLQIPELNTGFDVPYWYRGVGLTTIKSDEYGCFVDSKEIVEKYHAEPGRLVPLCFKADVEHGGNYEVSLTLYASGEVLVFAGPRRLVYHTSAAEDADISAVGNTSNASTANNTDNTSAAENTRLKLKKTECKFLLNVCDIVPRGKTSPYKRLSIDIAVLGENVRLSEFDYKQVDCPTLYIAGDSTVTDQTAEYPYAPETSYSGWGQMLSAYLKGGVAVSNHAHSGLTTDSFQSEGHYAIVESLIKEGDYLFLQFAHNDQKLDYLKAKEGYRERLCAYINEARAKGAYPVIVTPLSRNTWKAADGTYNDLLEEYADECIAIGKEFSVPVVDLHARSMELILELGLTPARSYFYPKDYTHMNDYGAYRMAGYVAEEYRAAASAMAGAAAAASSAAETTTSAAGKTTASATTPSITETTTSAVETAEMASSTQNDTSGYQYLASLLTDGFGEWKAKDGIPVAPEAPGEYVQIQKSEDAKDAVEEVERPDDILTRVEALDFVIRTARFFPTNVFNDEFDDVVGHEWYAGLVECACQNGLIPPEMVADKKFLPEKNVSLEEFLCLIMNGYRCRKPFPEEKPCAYDDECTAYCRSSVRAAAVLGVLKENDRIKEDVTRRRAAEICTALGI